MSGVTGDLRLGETDRIRPGVSSVTWACPVLSLASLLLAISSSISHALVDKTGAVIVFLYDGGGVHSYEGAVGDDLGRGCHNPLDPPDD